MTHGIRTFNHTLTQTSYEPQTNNPPTKVQIRIISDELSPPESSPEPACAG